MLSVTRYSIRNESLTPWIKFIWYFEAANADIHNKLLPTDCIDVILNLSDKIIYETASYSFCAAPFHINGLRSEHSYIHHTGTVRIFGISFYPFGLLPFVKKPLASIQDKIIDLYTLSKPLAQNLKLAVTDSVPVEKIIENIENVLLSELQVNSDYIHKAKLIYEFMEAADNVKIQSFCRERRINIKTFERMVLLCTGYTPKLLHRIRRFQVASNQLVHQDSTNLTGITYDNCFTDQAHLIKEFQNFSGTAPRAFQQEKVTIKENTKYSYI